MQTESLEVRIGTGRSREGDEGRGHPAPRCPVGDKPARSTAQRWHDHQITKAAPASVWRPVRQRNRSLITNRTPAERQRASVITNRAPTMWWLSHDDSSRAQRIASQSASRRHDAAMDWKWWGCAVRTVPRWGITASPDDLVKSEDHLGSPSHGWTALSIDSLYRGRYAAVDPNICRSKLSPRIPPVSYEYAI